MRAGIVGAGFIGGVHALALRSLTLKEYRVAFTFNTVDIAATSATAGK